MGEHREKHTIFGPFPDADPLDTARLFLRTNRFQIVDEQSGATPAAMQLAPPQHDDDEVVDDREVEEDEQDEDCEEVGKDEDEEDEEDAADPAPTTPAVERLDEVVTRLEATRGERWAGFTSSNMADLETTIVLKLIENSIQLEYVVNTTGQFLNDDERGYWAREARALESFVTGGDLVTIISDESSRASQARRDLLTRGLWFAAVLFFVLTVAGIMYARV